MKRLMALMGALALVAFTITSASAQSGGGGRVLYVEALTWRTQNNGTLDSCTFKETGASNATRDTSKAFVVTDIAPPPNGIADLGDSTLFLRVNIFPAISSCYGTSLGAGGDSAYAYLEASDDGGTVWDQITNCTEILDLETTNGAGTALNNYSFAIAWGRRPQELQGRRLFRVIVRGDLAGEYEGNIAYYSAVPSKQQR